MTGNLQGESALPSILQPGEGGPWLPPELLLLILEHLRAPLDVKTLCRTCLVSKQFLSICQPYLFDHISLGAPKAVVHSKSRCSIVYRVLCESPRIVLYIRHLSILSGSLWRGSSLPMTRRWISSDETLPALLDILFNSTVQSFRMRLSGEPWRDLPVALQSSIRSLIDCPSLIHIDFTGFDVIDTVIFQHCRSLQRLKFSEMAEILVENKSDTSDVWPATLESLTLLDTVDVGAVISWVIATPSFRALRDLRLGFDPLNDVPHAEDLLRHVSGTLESLHLQPVYTAWPQPANFLAINRLFGLTSLRLSLGIAVDSNPIPWVVFLLTNLGQIRLQHLTIDLRFDENRDTIHSLPWAELDSALCEPSLADVPKPSPTYEIGHEIDFG
ncbi:hypothetical protein DFH08DRAFT_825453 [Mycena albidolilacea]|uniref:F-box domain-containing protein n=1 Tax=Mycena albidolilacea TaxID=1033008 RepID=A0AAD6Z273_9AGAR|nr:hypothetical protein DFH08DRAFT_825453 [Mycena albidolilacea]